MKIVKTLLILLVITSTRINAGYVDITHSNEYKMHIRSNANGFAFDASKGDTDRIGTGFALKHQSIEYYIGAGYQLNDTHYYFSEFLFRADRNIIYGLSVDYVDGKKPDSVKLTGSYLFSERFGLVASNDFINKRFELGFRFWM